MENSISFKDICFQGKFRSYQAQVLENLEKHKMDSKIHIVAAPGSGKTILGLELIRRLGAPALILSPTVLIQHQWGQRFDELFLEKGQTVDDYVSESTDNPKLITSLTYQGMYSAFKGAKESKQLPLCDYIKKLGVKTICLDEAHHLKTNWHHALESVLKTFEGDITIISLTATPPCDSTQVEWSRYIRLCGEIDEEIPVPPLVKDGTLCPHQDFIFFSHPSREEQEKILAKYVFVEESLKTILEAGLVEKLVAESEILSLGGKNEDWLLGHIKGVSSILVMANKKNMEIPKKIVEEYFPKGKMRGYSVWEAEKAFQFVVDNPEIFSLEIVALLQDLLVEHKLFLRGKVTLEPEEETAHILASSHSKLGSIGAIAKQEQENLGEELRLVVLTDFIDQGLINTIGSDTPISEMGAVPVFEVVRRVLRESTPMAVLTGSVVIVPSNITEIVKAYGEENGTNLNFKPLAGTCYSTLESETGNRAKVKIITRLFEEGILQVIVGTKALLGEGWDSPCINSLIIASFIGSYVLSNQMRGRAIRRDKHNPNKVSNIWHLVTVISGDYFGPTSNNTTYSEDFATMLRRFECFLAPDYSGKYIENGIRRLGDIHPPANLKELEEVNEKTLSLAADRNNTSNCWNTTLVSGDNLELMEVVEIPELTTPPATFNNLKPALTLSGVFATTGLVVSWVPNLLPKFQMRVAGTIGVIAFVKLLQGSLKKILVKFSPQRYISRLANALLNTLRELGEIESPEATAIVTADSYGTGVQCGLSGGSLREKQIFCKAMGELLSPFDSPRYIICGLKGKKRDYYNSYACPSVINSNVKRVEVFRKHLLAEKEKFEAFYTSNEEGRKALLQASRYSYINQNDEYVRSKKIVKSSGLAEEAVTGTVKGLGNEVKNIIFGFLGGGRR